LQIRAIRVIKFESGHRYKYATTNLVNSENMVNLWSINVMSIADSWWLIADSWTQKLKKR